MEKKNSSSKKSNAFHIGKNTNTIMIILILISTIPIGIGFAGIFDQFTQPVIVHTAISETHNGLYNINLEDSSIYYITISLSDIDTEGVITSELSFYKETEEVYNDVQQKTIKSRQRGTLFTFTPFTSSTEGSYIINCTINYIDTTYPFYIKMQKAAGIAQLTGYSGEQILNAGGIFFLAVIVLLIVVSIIARFSFAMKARKLADDPESETSKFVWKSKKENEEA